jgi:hypothetical protein
LVAWRTLRPEGAASLVEAQGLRASGSAEEQATALLPSTRPNDAPLDPLTAAAHRALPAALHAGPDGSAGGRAPRLSSDGEASVRNASDAHTWHDSEPTVVDRARPMVDPASAAPPTSPPPPGAEISAPATSPSFSGGVATWSTATTQLAEGAARRGPKAAMVPRSLRPRTTMRLVLVAVGLVLVGYLAISRALRFWR